MRRTTCAVAVSLAMVGIAYAGDSVRLADNSGHAPPLAYKTSNGNSALYLELVINTVPTGQVVPVQYRDGTYYARAGDLGKVSVRTGNGDPEQLIDLNKLDGVRVEYDSINQRLLLTVPTDWLPSQTIGSMRLYDRTPAKESPGLLFNYDAYSDWPTAGSGYTSAWTEERLLSGWGTISNTGIYRYGYGAASQNTPGDKRYLRYDTTWTYSDQDRMITFAAGDLISGALSWSNAVRLGGVSLSRDFSVRPDVITYPLPQFAGQAAVPTAVDLFINGSKASTGQVNPGPFTMSNVPFINGAGEATVVTTDALGRQVATTIPFYVANTLLQRGWTDYSLSAGAMRRNYGIESLSYGRPAASASARYGLTDHVTIEAHGEGGEQLVLGGAGIDVGIGVLGVANASATESRLAGASGQQYTFGYTYSSQRLSVSAQRTQRTSGFRDLSVYDLPLGTTYSLERSITQATGALNLGLAWGTLGIGYFDVVGGDSNRTRIANVSYSRPLFGRATLYAALNRTIGGEFAAQLQLIISLGNRGTVTSLAEHGGGGWSEGAQYSRSVPSDGGVGGDLAYTGGASRYQQADLTWRNRYFQIAGGAYGSNGASGAGYTRWSELQGSLVAMDSDVLAANRVTDAFALVRTQGQEGIPVRYENQLVGITDSHGHLLVPSVPSYYPAKYEIDPLNLPSNDQALIVEQHIAVRRNGGALVSFPIRRVVSARITLVDPTGKPLKVGERVVHDESGQHAIVGWSGDTFLEGLSAENHLTVTGADGEKCHVSFALNLNAKEISHVGPLVCRE